VKFNLLQNKSDVLSTARLMVYSFGLIFLSNSATPALSSTFRNIAPDVQRVFCKGQPDTKMLWKSDFFDAQVEAARVKVKNKKAKLEELLSAKAQTLQNQLGYRSHSFFQCNHLEGIVLTFRSPAALVRNSSREFQLPKDACKSWDVKFAPASLGNIEPVNITSNNFSVKGDGSVSVVCQNEVPEEWFLAPVGKGPPSTAPLVSQKDLLAWLNAIRKTGGLGDVTNKVFPKSHGHFEVQHSASELQEVAAIAKKQNLYLLNESRVIATDLKEAATLLWNSPHHRQAILNKDARYASIQVENLPNRKQKLFVIFMFKDNK
jgi:hypothetical protein